MIHADPSLSLAERLDAACDRFESEWKAGRCPKIDNFLAAAPESDREELRQALLAIELELQGRGEAGTSVSRSSVRTDDKARPELTVQFASDGNSPAANIGRFEIRGVLGAGAFGRVYQAFDPQLGREVAIKVPLETAVASDGERARFLKEARAAATINHPNVCQIHEVGEFDGRPYIVMALVQGQSLADTLKARKEPLPEKQAALIVRKIALALSAAHDKGIVHRDLKPANVMFDRERKDIIVTDFGLARGPRFGDAQGTQSGVIMGTPAYMSPEQASGGSKDVGPAADVFGLGVILYELLAFTRPYSGTPTEIIGQILHVEPKPPSLHRPGIDGRLEAACLKAMAKDPAARFHSMKEFAAAIDGILRAPPPAGPAVETARANQTRREGDDVSTNMADVFAAMSMDRKQARVETAAAVEAAVAKARTPRWMFVAIGLFLVVGFTAIAGIVFFTRSANAHVKLALYMEGVNLADKELSFFLDDDPISAEALNNEIELKPGEHVLTVKRHNKIVKRILLTVTGGRNPNIKPKDITPPTPTSTPEEEDREFAEWLFSIGVGSVSVSIEGGPEKGIGKLANLPAGPFRVTAFDSWGNAKITDRTVDPILRWIERRRVERVVLFGNPIGDETVRRLVKLPSLKKIFLGDTRITPACIPDLATRTDLVALALQNRPIGDADLEKLRGLVNLSELDLGGTLVTDAGLKHLRRMKKLRILFLNLTAVTGAGLDELAGLPLEQLALGYTKVRGAEGLIRLNKLPELKTVHLEGLLLGDADLKPLTDCKSIERSNLHDNHLTDAGLDELAQMKWLKFVSICHAVWRNPVTPAGIERLRNSLPNCNVVYEVAAAPADSDRAAAEWVLSIGGQVRLAQSNRIPTSIQDMSALPQFNRLEQLPKTPFHLIGVELNEKIDEANETELAKFNGLKNLLQLGLMNTRVTDRGLAVLTDLPELCFLNLHATRITNVGLKSVARFRKLEQLWLHYLPLTDEGVAELVGLTNLKSLVLTRTKITDRGLKHISYLRRLEGLDITQTQVTDAGMTELANLTELNSLNVSGAEFTGAGLKALHRLPKLAQLQLDGPTLTDEGLASLPRLTRLTWLQLTPAHNITDASLKHLAGMTHLGVLRVTSNRVTADGLVSLSKLDQVWELRLSGAKITDDGLQHLAPLWRLRTLDLSGTAVTGTGLRHLTKNGQLDILILNDCPITDAGLTDITGLKALGHLNLGRTKITDAGLTSIAKLAGLKDIDLSNTAATNDGLVRLKKALPGCQITPAPKDDQK